MPDPFERMDEDIRQQQHEEKLDRAVDQVRKFIKKSSAYRQPYLDRAREARRDYTVWERRGRSPIGRTQLHLPFEYLIIQQEIPNIVAPFLKESTPFKLRGQEQTDFQWENSLTDFVGAQFRQMEFKTKLLPYVEGLAVEGTSIAKVPYRFIEKMVAVRKEEPDPFTGEMTSFKEEALEVMFDGPDLEDVELDKFFPDWSVRQPGQIQSMRACAHEVDRTFEELKRHRKRRMPDGTERGVYENLNELEHSLQTKGCRAGGPPYWSEDIEGLDEDAANREFKKDITLWEYWGLFDPKGDGNLEEYVITIANGDVAIRCEKNPYDYRIKPFVATVNVPVKGEWYGVSELFAVRGLIKEATSLRGSRLDSVHLGVNTMWMVDRTAGINPKTLYRRPNGIVYTNNMTGLQPLQSPDVPPSAYRELQELGSEIQQTAGSSSGPDLTQAAKTFGRSATGVSFVSGIAASRSAMKIHLLSEMFIKQLVWICLATNSQYVSEEQWVRVSGESENPFSFVPASAFHTKYDYEVATSISVDRNEEQQTLQLGFQYLSLVAQAEPDRIDWQPFFEDMGRSLFGRRMRKFVRSDEAVMAIQQQKLAAEQELNARVGARAQQPNSQPLAS